MIKTDLLNKIPWLWIAVIVLSMLVILQYLQLLELRKVLWYSFGGVAAEQRTRALKEMREMTPPESVLPGEGRPMETLSPL